ncbi:PREDICTED: uncharacterized protein LOC104604011 [Nelumbo nucifera]|uniref:Uncharacterized protein LOC104604011 n=2 Tax=Nelumbo nucifera TaxID=4432 RepID=A0A1U8AKK9_NELNU|nr:PREDICTED: uncharacterized protein LOC104604011 [Nelumbo nucifera]DAD36265.1 TPA_asm: hypothetical protein HUJ06_006905 [Nelumbo nucifera]
MYADFGVADLFPYFQGFSLEVEPLEEFCGFQKNNASTSNLIQTFTISEYDLGGEGDLFKAPEPIIEEPEMALDPITAAVSVISSGENVMSYQIIKDTDMESIQGEHLLSEVFYGCKNALMAKSAISSPEVSDIKFPSMLMEDVPIAEKDQLVMEGPIEKTFSSECLSSMEWTNCGAIRPNFLDFQVDFDDAYGIRRAFSEGDIQTLGDGNMNFIHSHFKRPFTIGNYTIEERMQRLSRYRKKKMKRNFGRKIKYACRKALADSQPRVRGRFARTEELEVSKK